MDDVAEIKKLFLAVYKSQKKTLRIQEKSIRQAVGNMGKAYWPNHEWENDSKSITTLYKEAGQRCAYLLKYAMIHTGLACEVLQEALKIYSVKSSIEAKETLNICSLGSGPGTDIVALMYALQDKFGSKRFRASLIDQSKEWESVFSSIISELKSQQYSISKMVANNCFSFEYLEANLLNKNNERVLKAIGTADIITMIKFVSAAACKNTRDMVMNIFLDMKPGALLLFIDNAAGGFYEMLEEMANMCSLESVFGPLEHYDYEEKALKIEIDGFTSQYKTKVAVEIWKKTKKYNSLASNADEIDYPILEAQSIAVNQSSEKDNFSTGAQFYNDITNVQEGNIHLQAEMSTENDDLPKCCIIM